MQISSALPGLIALASVLGSLSLGAAASPVADQNAASSSLLLKRTLDPATSNTKGKCPSKTNCSATKVSKAIQAAECSHNTRTGKTQTFAVFVTDHKHDSSHGAPYGDCSAYTCAAPSAAEMDKVDEDCWTFFWDAGGEKGESDGEGAGCIRSPDDGTCGCENSDGTWVPGGTDCK